MSLEEQLAGVKLKTSDQPVRDYSDPKLAGFLQASDVDSYQKDVLEVNTERWLSALQHLTFPTQYCPITLTEAQLFIRCYEKCYKDKTPGSVAADAWKTELAAEEMGVVESMIDRLSTVMADFLAKDSCVFVKTSSRSAKDAVVYQGKFKCLYAQEIDKLDSVVGNISENDQITCLLIAAFRALKIASAEEVIETFLSSERIYQDFLLAVQQKQCFEENFVIRKFVDIDIDMEFRGFVYGHKLTAISQYNYLIHSKRLCELKAKLETLLVSFFNDQVSACLQDKQLPDNYIIDFAVCDFGSINEKTWVIELNPFMTTTDGALFSWQHELALLQGKKEFEFRITERPKPGAKAMLPYSIRQLIQ